jgi:hypothetical protein
LLDNWASPLLYFLARDAVATFSQQPEVSMAQWEAAITCRVYRWDREYDLLSIKILGYKQPVPTLSTMSKGGAYWRMVRAHKTNRRLLISLGQRAEPR